jgi:hypothetical protein
MSEHWLVLSLQIDRSGGEAPTGQLAAPHSQPQRFAGWLGLMAAIRAACEAHSRSPEERRGG